MSLISQSFGRINTKIFHRIFCKFVLIIMMYYLTRVRIVYFRTIDVKIIKTETNCGLKSLGTYINTDEISESSVRIFSSKN